MRFDLRSRLAFVVSLASAGATACSGTGVLDDCPHTVVDKSFVVELSPDAACALAANVSRYDYSIRDLSACRAACSDQAINTCLLPWGSVDPNGGDAGACSVTPDGATRVPLTCQITHGEGSFRDGCPVNGRRPDGLRPARRTKSRPSERGNASPLGIYFAACAHLEAASVIAFREMRRELAAHRAPARLKRAAARAEREEIRHTVVTRALTRRFGGAFAAPRVTKRSARSLEAIALENAVEGVVRETYGAAQALFSASHAEDVEVQRAMREIAEDECRHAALSWELAAWAGKQLDAPARRRIDRATRAAIAGLRREVMREPLREVRLAAGVPSSAEALRMLDGLAREVWARRPT